MFDSFFPRPKLFLWSAIGWFFVTLFAWYGFFDALAPQFSLMKSPIELAEGERAPFLTPTEDLGLPVHRRKHRTVLHRLVLH